MIRTFYKIVKIPNDDLSKYGNSWEGEPLGQANHHPKLPDPGRRIRTMEASKTLPPNGRLTGRGSFFFFFSVRSRRDVME